MLAPAQSLRWRPLDQPIDSGQPNIPNIVDMLAAFKQTRSYTMFKEWTKALRRRAKLSYYRGTQYRCPVCDIRLRAFKPIWRSFWTDYQQYEFIRSPFSMETFNAGAFSSPACDAYAASG